MDTTCILDPFSEDDKTNLGEKPKKDWKQANDFLTTLPQTDCSHAFEEARNMHTFLYNLAIVGTNCMTLYIIKRPRKSRL